MANRFSRLSIWVFFLTLTHITQAADDQVFSISGFGTFGVVHSNTRKVDIVRDLAQSDGVGFTRQTDFGMDSNLGLQINAHATDNIDAAIQVVSRRSANDFQPEITWAYARYLYNDNFQLRAGRLGFDVYPLADSRNVGYSYLWVRPPVDFFGSLIVSYFDGMDMTVSQAVGQGILRSKLFIGVAREKTLAGEPGEFLSLNHSPLYGGHIEYQSQNWLFRLGYVELKFKNEIPHLQTLLGTLHTPELNALLPGAANLSGQLSLKDKRFRYLSAGIVYDQGPLQAQLMFNQLSSESLFFPTNRAAYLTLGYRLDRWTPYFTYSASRPVNYRTLYNPSGNTSPESGNLLNTIDQAIANQLNRQTTFSLGLRYDLTDKSNVKLQFDKIKSDNYLLIRNNQAGWDGRANLISLAFNYIF